MTASRRCGHVDGVGRRRRCRFRRAGADVVPATPLHPLGKVVGVVVSGRVRGGVFIKLRRVRRPPPVGRMRRYFVVRIAAGGGVGVVVCVCVCVRTIGGEVVVLVELGVAEAVCVGIVDRVGGGCDHVAAGEVILVICNSATRYIVCMRRYVFCFE